ncbi:MAG: NCS2 family permease [Gemmatimonadota bacterium]|jgi:AGZA family xanthine/uracil permease-like MFS transporter|nr:NCS2 family permease [Gemmatimonadota bacterium]MDQ8146601.1 NCS2 family permease [Gemmatimonadota bacterium]MDQ8148526.1 NCS2 family permease [Gemmatimonadota bacterium]MDQ8156415.1 NCS2 family permease [Gemmatimonadota bacterium]MDQ8175955.1 NCS2 family permease [Gemmatimonadota bacterium]
MIGALRRALAAGETTLATEVRAGVATFITMAYIVVVNPAILEAAGIPREASVTATILSAVFGTLLMGVYANRPFAIAPYMGENAFIAFTVVKGMGFPWQTALGAIFLAGIAFTLLTVFRIRGWLAAALPRSLKHAFAVGIGLFVTFIGLNDIGVVALGAPGAPVALGALRAPPTLIALGALGVTLVLMARRVTGALTIGILLAFAGSMLAGITPTPTALLSAPPSLAPTLGQLDVAGALTLEALPVVVIVFVMAFVDTIGTLFGLSAHAGLLDADGNLPDVERPMLADALSNLFAPIVGTTTTGAYIESAVGIEEGGRTGLTAVVVAVLFLLALWAAPILTAVPLHASGVALVAIGVLMLKPLAALDTADATEWIPALFTIVLMSFTYNIGVGMTAGLLLHPLLKVATGRRREVPAALWVLAALSLLFYLVYPYR